MPNLTKISEWAASLGISRQQGYEAVKRCEIPVEDGKVDTEYATLLYRRHTRARAGTRPGKKNASSAALDREESASAGGGYETARARREAAEAEIAEIKLGELSGRFLVRDEVDVAAFEVARALRDGLSNCARRIAGDVAGVSDAAKCEEIIDREHRILLEAMAQSFASSTGVSLHLEGDPE